MRQNKQITTNREKKTCHFVHLFIFFYRNNITLYFMWRTSTVSSLHSMSMSIHQVVLLILVAFTFVSFYFGFIRRFLSFSLFFFLLIALSLYGVLVCFFSGFFLLFLLTKSFSLITFNKHSKWMNACDRTCQIVITHVFIHLC